MTNRLPSRINVGPIAYKVRSAPLDSRMGQTSAWTTLIELDPRQSDEAKRDTLLHEILHACHQVAGIGVDEPVNVEQFVTSVSPFLLDALRRSPGLVAYLTER